MSIRLGLLYVALASMNVILLKWPPEQSRLIIRKEGVWIMCFKLNNKTHISLHGKPYFPFRDVLKRWSFQTNRAGIWSFLYYWERWYFFFPKIWSYTLGRKWKMIFLKKYTEIWYFLQAFWKDGLSKRGRADGWYFLYYLERWFFSLKAWSSFPGQEVKDGLSQEIHGNMMHRPAKKNREPDI